MQHPKCVHNCFDHYESAFYGIRNHRFERVVYCTKCEGYHIVRKKD